MLNVYCIGAPIIQYSHQEQESNVVDKQERKPVKEQKIKL